MRLTLIYPAVEKKERGKYIKSWQMEPLAIGILYALTPRDIEVRFYDDRVEDIPYDEETDIVALSVETYSARRSYAISEEYRRRGVAVVMGGFHATLMQEEVSEHADAVVMGNAEGVWAQLIEDFRSSRMKRVYRSDDTITLGFATPDRSIFKGKPYLALSLIETSRGCQHDCEFCSVTSYYNRNFTRRPINDVIAEIDSLRGRTIFFVDDNIVGNIPSALELFDALKGKGVSWISQCSIDAARNDQLMDAMAASGCVGLLIGFESIAADNLQEMRKMHNGVVQDYSKALEKMRRRGIVVYGTFVLGYDGDTEEIIRQTVEFSESEKMYIAAFNHLVPFPGTALYKRLKEEGRLRREKWWNDPGCKYGDIFYEPRNMTWKSLTDLCLAARKRFYRWQSIAARSLDRSANCRTLKMAILFFSINMMLKREVMEKRKVWSEK